MTCCGVPGVYAPYPEYEMNALSGSAGSIAMPETNRPGVAAVSTRKKCALLVSTSLDTHTRPLRVPAHIVPVSLGARSVATTNWPPRSLAEPAVRLLPIGTQSPQGAPSRDSELQCASRYAGSPPLSSVRQTCSIPVNARPPVTGSAMNGT